MLKHNLKVQDVFLITFLHCTDILSKCYLVLIIFFWKLDVDIMVSTDLGDYGTLATDDLGVIFGIHSDGQLKAPEGLLGKKVY